MNKKQIKEKPGIVKIVFDYPFELAVPDEKYIIKLSPTEYAIVETRFREGLISYDKNLLLRGKSSKGVDPVGIQEITTPEKKKVGGLRAWIEDEKPAIDLYPGEYGKAVFPWHYTEVVLKFAINDLKFVTVYDDLFNHIRRFFNKFLLVYKDAFHDYHIPSLKSEEDFVNYYEIWLSEITEEEKQHNVTDILLSNRVYKPLFTDAISPVAYSKAINYGRNNVKKEIYNGKQLFDFQYFLNNLTTIKPIFIFNEILLHGLEKIALDKDFRFAILEFETAFEMAVLYFLHYFLRKQGKTEKEARDIIDTDQNYWGIKKKIKRLDTFLTKEREGKQLDAVAEFYGSDIYTEWENKVYSKRNNAVHEWANYTKNDAEEAFTASQKAIRNIQKRVKDTITEDEVVAIMSNK